MIKIREVEKKKTKEQYLYKIAKRVLDWAAVEYTQEEVWQLVMLELSNIKEKK